MSDQTTLADAQLCTGYGDALTEASEGPNVWLRVPARGALRICFLRELPIHYRAHWLQGRYTPCPGPEQCTWCHVGQGHKTRYVFTVYDADRKRTGLVEVTPEVAAQIKAIADDLGTIVGTLVRLTKADGRVNGAIQVQPMHQYLKTADLPEGPDALKVLRQQWSMPTE